MRLLRVTEYLFWLTSFTQIAYPISGRMCTVRRSRVTSFVDGRRASHLETYMTSCGPFGWRRCRTYRTRYRYVTQRRTRVEYYTARVCCSGWRGPSCSIHNQTPSVSYCPSDVIVKATGRTANVRWRKPQFREPFNYRMTLSSTYPANRATLAWGSHRVTYTARSSNNGREVTCSFTVTVEPPLAQPTIYGQQSGSVVNAEVGTSVALACRLGCSKPPFHLTWTKMQKGTAIAIRRGQRYNIDLCAFQDYRNATNVLTYTPRLDDNNTVLSCTSDMLTHRPDRANVRIRVSYTRPPRLVNCPANFTSTADRKEVNVSWPDPVFDEPLGFKLNVTSTFGTNTTSLGLGEHKVEYIAKNTYNNKETACVFYIDVTPPLAQLVIDGQPDGSLVNAEVGIPLTLTCRVDCGKPPFHLVWMKSPTDAHFNVRKHRRNMTQLCGYQDYIDAVDELMYIPRLEDDNTTLTCIGNLSTPSLPVQVAVKLHVSYTRNPVLTTCPTNITIVADGKEITVSWPKPEFYEPLGFRLNITSTFGTNSTLLGWGEHRVEYIARNTYNDKEIACVFYIDVTPPLAQLVIEGKPNGSVVNAEVDIPITLTCRVDCGKPPFHLVWMKSPTDAHFNIIKHRRNVTHLCGYQDYIDAVDELTYIPRLEDDNTTLMCIGNLSTHSLPVQVAVKLHVSYTRNPVLTTCPTNITIVADGKEITVSWPKPEFYEPLGFRLNITSTFGTNSTLLGWGEHRVEYIARNTYNDKEIACVFYIDVTPPLAQLVIEGQPNGSVVNAEVDIPLTLTCRVDCDKPPFHLVWMKSATDAHFNIIKRRRNVTHLCGYQDYIDAVDELTYIPRLEDDNTTLMCIGNLSTHSLPVQVAVKLHVSYIRNPVVTMCPTNITIVADWNEVTVSWPQPEFYDPLGFPLNITSTFGKNSMLLGWGEHRVEYIARNTYNDKETACLFYIDVMPPPDTPEIAGFNNRSTISVHVGSAIILVCRADHGDSPYILTWTNGSHEISEGTRYYTEPHGFRNLTNAVNELTFMPKLGDNNTTLTCVANKSEPKRLEHVAVTLNVSYTTPPDLVFCPRNISLEAVRGERVKTSWPKPKFSEPLGFPVNISSAFDTNTTSLGWGEHRVEYTARNTYNNMETSCVFYIDVRPPFHEPLIVGHENNSILDVTVGTPISLTCRADYGDPPYLLTWTNRLELNDKIYAVTETTTKISVETTAEMNDTENQRHPHDRTRLHTTAESTIDVDSITHHRAYDLSTTPRQISTQEEKSFLTTNSLPGSRFDTEPSGYRQTQNATNRLTFVPRFEDDKTTLYCVATRNGRRLLVTVLLNVTGSPDGTAQQDSRKSALPTYFSVPAQPTGVVQMGDSIIDEQADGGDYIWLMIPASCAAAIIVLGAIVAMIYYRLRSHGQMMYDGNTPVNATYKDHTFENPVYEAIE